MENPFERRPGNYEKECPICKGEGGDSEGNTYKTCNGRGKVNRH